ncbi:hypothetical protein EMIT047CA2_220027 [Pseudomonas soli]
MAPPFCCFKCLAILPGSAHGNGAISAPGRGFGKGVERAGEALARRLWKDFVTKNGKAQLSPVKRPKTYNFLYKVV